MTAKLKLKEEIFRMEPYLVSTESLSVFFILFLVNSKFESIVLDS